MSKESEKLENEIILLRSAVHASGRFKDQRVVDTDPKYRASVFVKQVELAELQKAESSTVGISPAQLASMNGFQRTKIGTPAVGEAQGADLAFLNRAQAAVNPASGKRYVEEQPKLRANLTAARAAVFEGQPLNDTQRAFVDKIAGAK